MRLQRTLRRLFTEHRYSIPHRIPAEKKVLDKGMLALALLSVIVFIVELAYDLHHPVLTGFSLIVDFTFLADYLLRAYHSGLDIDGKWSLRRSADNYLLRWYGLVDAIATLPPILTHVFHIFTLFTEFTRASRMLRLARFTRFLRFLRAVRLFRETRNVTAMVRDHHSNISRELNFTIAIVLIVIIAGGLGLHYIQGPQDVHYEDPGDAIYWSILSVMGQSDGSVLESWSARVLGLAVIFAGIAFFGIVSGSITTFIMEAMNKRMSGKEAYQGDNHIVVCGLNSKLEELVGYLRRLPGGHDIVLLFDSESEQAAQEFVGEQMNEYARRKVTTLWVRGNPRTEEGLRRANVLAAHEIIVLADEAANGLSEEDLDARTLMTLEMLTHLAEDRLHREEASSALTWRKKLSTDQTHERRAGNGRLSVTIELKTPQCVKLAKSKGANVVYADDLICQYITLDAHAHEASSIYSRLIDTHDQSVELRSLDLAHVRSLKGEDVLPRTQEALQAEGRMLLGFNVPFSFVLDAFGRHDAFETALEGAGLVEDAEEQWQMLREKMQMVHDGDGSQRKDTFELVNLRSNQHFSEILDMVVREARDLRLPVLNPHARRILIDRLMDTALHTTVEHEPMQAICMRMTYSNSTRAETTLVLQP